LEQKKRLAEKKNRTDEESRQLTQIRAVEAAKASAADTAICNGETSTMRSFTAKLRANADVRQTFDPWEMDSDTGDTVSAVPNRLVTGNETLHQTHLHITVRDSQLGH
jgi:aspartokinase